VKWGVLGALGMETEHHQVGVTYLYTRVAEDSATLAEDTRGQAYFDPMDLSSDAAPFHPLRDAAIHGARDEKRCS
jgi:hypothetical protein